MATPSRQSKILFVSVWPYLGGAQASLLSVLEHLPDEVSPVLACPTPGPLPERALAACPRLELIGLPLRGATARRRGLMTSTWRLTRWAARNRSRLAAIHANGDAELKIALPAALATSTRLVVWLHQISPSTARLGPVWRFAHGIITWAPVSEASRSDGIRARILSPTNSHVVPNPIDPERCVAPRPEASLTGTRLVVGYLGGEVADKGVLTVASVVQRVAEGDSMRFDVVTKGWGAERNSSDVNEALAVLRANANVRMLPWSRESSPFGSMDVLLVPSRAETFCRIAAEAMANSIPVVASDLPAIREVVGDGVAGLLFPPEDSEAALACLRRLANEPGLRADLGNHGLERSTRFLPDRVVAALLALYGCETTHH